MKNGRNVLITLVIAVGFGTSVFAGPVPTILLDLPDVLYDPVAEDATSSLWGGWCASACGITCEHDSCEVECDTSHSCARCYCWGGHSYCSCRPKVNVSTDVPQQMVEATLEIDENGTVVAEEYASGAEPAEPAEGSIVGGLCASHCAIECPADEPGEGCSVDCNTEYECARCYCWFNGHSYCDCRPRLGSGVEEANACYVADIAAPELVPAGNGEMVAVEEGDLIQPGREEHPATESGICASYCERTCPADEEGEGCSASCNTEYECALCYCWFNGHSFCSCRPRFGSGSAGAPEPVVAPAMEVSVQATTMPSPR